MHGGLLIRDIHATGVAPQVFVDGDGGTSAGCNGANDESRAGGKIPAGKNAGDIGGQRIGVHHQRAPQFALQFAVGVQKRHVGGLADGNNHIVGIHKAGIVEVTGRVEAPLIVKYTDAACEFNTGHAPLFVGDFTGRQVGINHDALIDGFVHVLFPGRHLVAGLQTENLRFLCTGPQGGAGNIHGHITAADNDRFTA